jgi:SAM-dependent methyltransferase
MINAKTIRTRLANLTYLPRTAPDCTPPVEVAVTIPSDWSPGNYVGDSGDDGYLEITPQEIEELLRAPSIGMFIEQSYRRILGRGPDFRGGLRHALLLKFWPTYSRKKFLNIVITSDEARMLRVRRLDKQGRRLDRERKALAQEYHALDHERRTLEHERRTIEHEREQWRQRDQDRDQLLRSLGALPGQHSRLLEQQRQLFERQLETFERLLALPGEQGELLGRMRQISAQLRDVPAQLSQIPEQLRLIPEQHERLLDQHRQLLQRYTEDGSDWLARVEGLQQEFVDRLQQAQESRPVDDFRSCTASDDLGGVERFVEDAYHLILRRAPEPSEFVEGRERLRAGLARIKREFLDGLLGGSSNPEPQALPAPAPNSPPAARPPHCRICGEHLDHKWSLKVLSGRYLAHYHECRECRGLQVVNPTWLDEAYTDESRPLANNPDQGRFARNFSAFVTFVALHEAGLVARRPVVLDFGGGYGLLAQMLKSGGYDAWQVDPYVPVPFLAADRSLHALDDFPDAGFDLIFALEVLEHLTDPMTTLGGLMRRLKPGGTLMLSTEIYHPGIHDQNWPYLGTEWGQHITFWSRPALLHAAEHLGFSSLGLFPGEEGFFILFSRLPADALRARLSTALTRLRDPDLSRRAVAGWDLQNLGYIRMLDEPVVEDLDASGHTDTFTERGAA